MTHPLPLSPQAVELAEIDAELGEAVTALRAREITPRERFAEREAFLLLNREILDRRDALARAVALEVGAARLLRPMLPLRRPDASETPAEKAHLDTEANLIAKTSASPSATALARPPRNAPTPSKSTPTVTSS